MFDSLMDGVLFVAGCALGTLATQHLEKNGEKYLAQTKELVTDLKARVTKPAANSPITQ